MIFSFRFCNLHIRLRRFSIKQHNYPLKHLRRVESCHRKFSKFEIYDRKNGNRSGPSI